MRSRRWRRTRPTARTSPWSSSGSISERGQERQSVPEQGDDREQRGGCRDGGSSREHGVDHEQYDGLERDGRGRDPRDREPVAHRDHAILVALPEAEPMVRARRREQRNRDGGREEGDHEHVALERGDARPAVGERNGEEEREQDGYPGEYDAQLVQQLDQLPVGALLRRLLVPRPVLVHVPDATGSRRSG